MAASSSAPLGLAAILATPVPPLRARRSAPSTFAHCTGGPTFPPARTRCPARAGSNCQLDHSWKEESSSHALCGLPSAPRPGRSGAPPPDSTAEWHLWVRRPRAPLLREATPSVDFPVPPCPSRSGPRVGHCASWAPLAVALLRLLAQ